MVWIPAGTFWMGSEDASATDARPLHAVTLDGYWIDATEVTNEQFEQFVTATGYKTTAEFMPAREAGFDESPETLKPGSMVFLRPEGPSPPENPLLWWRFVAGADWRHPEGPKSTIVGREKHPVVHVTWVDATAYADWAGKRLPTEAEWECTAHGDLDRAKYVWGDELQPGGKWLANLWQGRFPTSILAEDGFLRTAPVGSFPPNGFGLRDMCGNVCEWCQDWYSPEYYADSPAARPAGPVASLEPSDPTAPRRVQRGGSFLSPVDSSRRDFGPGERSRGDPNSAASHLGFRCVKSPPP